MHPVGSSMNIRSIGISAPKIKTNLVYCFSVDRIYGAFDCYDWSVTCCHYYVVIFETGVNTDVFVIFVHA